MAASPKNIIPDDPDLLPAVRELLAQHSAYQERRAGEIAEDLFCLRYMSYQPHEAAIEAALVSLTLEGGLLS
jgi:hypothetical protein